MLEKGTEWKVPETGPRLSARSVDCVIAQASLEAEATLLPPDVDFERIAEDTRLPVGRPDADHD